MHPEPGKLGARTAAVAPARASSRGTLTLATPVWLGVDDLVICYVDGPRDWEAASLLCRCMHCTDALTFKHAIVSFCYATMYRLMPTSGAPTPRHGSSGSPSRSSASRLSSSAA